MDPRLLFLLCWQVITASAYPNDYFFPGRTFRTTSKKQEEQRPLDVTTSSIVKSSNDFGFHLLQTLPRTQNAFLSPLSMSLAIGMVYLGSRNDTSEELRRAMNYPPDVHAGFKAIMELLKPNQEAKRRPQQDGYKLEMANAILVDKSFALLKPYKEECRRYYDAAVESVSFSIHPEAAVDSVNGWVAWRTNNKILKILEEPMDPLTKLFLLNAVYFKGTWKTKFDQRLTMPDTFYNEGKIPKTVPMMRQKRKFMYGFDSRINAHILELPYVGEDIKMLLLLPEKRDGLQDMESSLTDALLQDIASTSVREVTAQVTLPRFTLTEEYDLIPILKRLGAASLFSEARANLGGISPEAGLYLSKVMHRSAIEVDEAGSEAAAVTGVSAGVRTGGPLVPLFTADHPFMFFVRDGRINATLFVGRVTIL